MAKAELSITKKANRRHRKKIVDGMEVDDLTASQNLSASQSLNASQNLSGSQALTASQAVSGNEEKKEEKKEEPPKPEPTFEILENPGRPASLWL